MNPIKCVAEQFLLPYFFSKCFFISFFTFNESMSPDNGQLGDLWLEGTFAYGAIVILANMAILYGSYSHTLISVLMISASVSAYFVIFWLFSSL